MDRRKFLKLFGLGAGAVGVTALPLPEFKEEVVPKKPGKFAIIGSRKQKDDMYQFLMQDDFYATTNAFSRVEQEKWLDEVLDGRV
jgi:hypothetical protein